MIPNKEKEGWDSLAVKKLSALLREAISEHDGDFYCLICIHSFRTENNLKSHEEVDKKIFFVCNCNAIKKS